MSRTILYRQHSIKSAPKLLRNERRWKVEIHIWWEEHGAITFKSFTFDLMYSTEAEADTHGIAFGQEIIDGNVPGVSLN
ncbi:MAG: hypothetical protein KGJ82_19330 [Nitrospirota bacterium]|nr:hypothetical protein [Nitrospirota bacterium]